MKYLKGIFKIFSKVWSLKISIILGGFFPLIYFLNYSTKYGDLNSFRFYNNLNDAGIYPSLGKFYDVFLNFFTKYLEWGDITAFLATIITIGSLFSIVITLLLFLRCFFSGDFEKELYFVLSKIK
jgi:hypothetical protein